MIGNNGLGSCQRPIVLAPPASRDSLELRRRCRRSFQSRPHAIWSRPRSRESRDMHPSVPSVVRHSQHIRDSSEPCPHFVWRRPRHRDSGKTSSSSPPSLDSRELRGCFRRANRRRAFHPRATRRSWGRIWRGPRRGDSRDPRGCCPRSFRRRQRPIWLRQRSRESGKLRASIQRAIWRSPRRRVVFRLRCSGLIGQ